MHHIPYQFFWGKFGENFGQLTKTFWVKFGHNQNSFLPNSIRSPTVMLLAII